MNFMVAALIHLYSPGLILDTGAPPIGARGLFIRAEVSHKSCWDSLLFRDGVFLLINPRIDRIIM